MNGQNGIPDCAMIGDIKGRSWKGCDASDGRQLAL
jgi:hypothetical protein